MEKKLWSSNEFHLILGFVRVCVCFWHYQNMHTHMNICRPPTPLEGSVEWLCDLLPPATPHIHTPEKHPVSERARLHTPVFDMLQEAMVPSRGQQTEFSARLYALPNPSNKHIHTCMLLVLTLSTPDSWQQESVRIRTRPLFVLP